MPRKLPLEGVDPLLKAWGVLERLSTIDLGSYYPIVTAGGENLFALALGSPGSPVIAKLETPEVSLDITLTWHPRVEKPRDLMAEQARRRSASGSLAASGKKPDSEKKRAEKSDRPEDQDDLGFKPSELDPKGAFELTVRNAPEGFELQDIRFEREGSDDQPITPVMRTGEVVIPDSDCDGAIESMDSKVYGRVTHRGPSRAPHKQASADEDSQKSHKGLIDPTVLTLTHKGFESIYRRDSGWVNEICKKASVKCGLKLNSNKSENPACDVSQLVWLKISGKRIDGFPFESSPLGDPSNLPLDLIQLAPGAIYKLAHDTAVDLRRQQRDHSSLDDQIDSNDSTRGSRADQLEDSKSIDPVESLFRKENIELVRVLISQLAERRHREAIELHYLKGMSYVQAAETMKLTVEAFKSLLFRVRDNLREKLESKLG